MSRDPTIGVIALVPDRWDDIVMPRHQVLRRLAGHFPVAWVEPAPGWRECWRPQGSRFLRGDGWSSPAEGLDVFAPGARHPLFLRPPWLGRLALRSRLVAARRHLLRQGAERIILYVWRDEFEPALDAVEYDASVYHIDDEYSFDERETPNSPREVELMRRVDQVIVHSPALLAKKGGFNPRTARVPNGVDYGAFTRACPEPADLRDVPHPRVGYAGVIKKQLDLGLLVQLAKARPTASFVMVGPVLNVSGKEAALDELRGLKNVYFIGGKPPSELPAYVQHFDVCLMCYEVNAYTRYIYPLKLNEYLATGLPTISSSIQTVVESGAPVMLAQGLGQWLNRLDEALLPEARSEGDAGRRRAYAQAHDWDALVGDIAALMREVLEAKKTAVSAPRANLKGGWMS